MNSQKCSILLIFQPEENKRTNLYDFLIDKNFDVYHALNIQDGISKAHECFPDLIICQNEMKEKNGLQVFQLLHDDILKKGTSFFLYMEEYNKEDVLIGLEMGVDNFVFMPFDEKALTHKIENQLGKLKKLRIFETENFKQQFKSTPVAKFVSDNNQIILMNPAFEKLLRIKNEENANPRIDDLFDFSENDTTLFNYRKCLNGLKDFHLFQSVLSKANHLLRFNIHLVHADYLKEGLFMAEIVPSYERSGEKNAGINGASSGFQVPLNGNNCQLTAREKEVLEWSAQGLPIKQIAEILRISERTVEKHRANIMAKTETSSIMEALYAIRLKMA